MKHPRLGWKESPMMHTGGNLSTASLKRCGDRHGLTACRTLQDTLNALPHGLGVNDCNGVVHPSGSSYVSKTHATTQQKRRPSTTCPFREKSDGDTRRSSTKKLVVP